MKQLIFILLLFSAQISCAKNNNEKNTTRSNIIEDGCEYKKGFIKHYEINDESILNYHWEELKSRRSGEYLTNLYIKYKNGNMALIEHKYCKMYNFTINFFVQHDRKNPIDDQKAATTISDLYYKHSAIKTTFTPSLTKVIEKNYEIFPKSWNDYQYDLNNSLEMHIHKSEIWESSIIFDFRHTFYIGIGGL